MTAAKQNSQAKPKRAEIKLKKDTWDERGERHCKGDIVSLPIELARQLVDQGKAERADPL